MPKSAFLAIVLTGVLTADPAAIGSAGPPPSDPPFAGTPAQQPTPVKTGKERLSDKASDEQRVDNCNVPPDRRGAKIRPDRCPGGQHQVPTN